MWAASKGRGEAFHMAAFKAYFVDGRNLAQTNVLLELASGAGLSGEEAKSVLSERKFKAAVDADWALSRKMGVTAVPTFIVNQDRLVGAQPYEVIEKLMLANGVEKRAEQ